jgi:uncharacterized protein YggE
MIGKAYDLWLQGVVGPSMVWGNDEMTAVAFQNRDEVESLRERARSSAPQDAICHSIVPLHA